MRHNSTIRIFFFFWTTTLDVDYSGLSVTNRIRFSLYNLNDVFILLFLL